MEGKFNFSDFIFHEKDVPFTMRYRQYNSVNTKIGLFVGLESLIVALYQDRRVARPLLDFLGEFRDALQLEKTPLFPNAKPKAALKPALLFSPSNIPACPITRLTITSKRRCKPLCLLFKLGFCLRNVVQSCPK